MCIRDSLYPPLTVALSGDTAVLAHRGSIATNGAPADVRVYQRGGTTWTETGRLVPSDSDVDFGRAISVGGNTIAVSGTGGVYVFARSGATWLREQKLVPSTGSGFGPSVSVGDGVVVVGAYFGSLSD